MDPPAGPHHSCNTDCNGKDRCFFRECFKCRKWCFSSGCRHPVQDVVLGISPLVLATKKLPIRSRGSAVDHFTRGIVCLIMDWVERPGSSEQWLWSKFDIQSQTLVNNCMITVFCVVTMFWAIGFKMKERLWSPAMISSFLDGFQPMYGYGHIVVEQFSTANH